LVLWFPIFPVSLSRLVVHSPGDISASLAHRRKREEKEGRGGGGRLEECAQFFKLDNPSVRTWFDTFLSSLSFPSFLYFYFFSV
jgi:hypothetical protein